MVWIKEDTAIAVYDSPLESKVLVYSALTGELLSRHQMPTPGLGVKQVIMSPNQIFMLVSFFDTKIKVFNGISQKEISTLDHLPSINLSSPEFSSTLIYKEEALKE